MKLKDEMFEDATREEELFDDMIESRFGKRKRSVSAWKIIETNWRGRKGNGQSFW